MGTANGSRILGMSEWGRRRRRRREKEAGVVKTRVVQAGTK